MAIISRRLALVACLWFAIAPVHAVVRGGYTTTPPVSCDITKNIVTDFSATGNAGDNATPAFVGTGSFHDFAVNTYQPANPGKTICLTVPAGTYTFGTFSGAAIFDGITNLVVNAPNATFANALNLTTTGVAGNVLSFASVPAMVSANLVGKAVFDVTNPSAVIGTVSSATSGAITFASVSGVSNGDVISIQTGGYFLGTAGMSKATNALTQAVSAGVTTITLQTPADASKFPANTFAVMTGVDLEGFGDPPNPYVWEYVFVLSANSGTGVVTIQSPLQFAYETTWPIYGTNQGGPATLYPFPASWNVSQIYNIGTVYQWNGSGGTLLNTSGRTITFNNTAFTNWGPNVSQQQTLTCNSCNLSNIARLETDKLWATATFNGGTLEGLFVQTGATTGTLKLNNVHVLSGGMSGSPATMSFTNSISDNGWQPGAVAFGQSGTVNCTNSTFTGSLALGGFSDTAIAAGTLSSGLITVPYTAEHPMQMAVPNADLFWTNSSTFGIPFTPTDFTGDGTNTFVTTSGLSGLSTLHAAASPGMRKINFSGCTGATNIVDMSQAGARNARPYTYSNRIYTCTNNVATIQAANPGVPVVDIGLTLNDLFISRSLQSFTVAVSPADTSATGTVTFHSTAQFDNYPIMNSSGALANWGAAINLKIAGTRSYNALTGVWSGTQTGDTLGTASIPAYMTSVMRPTVAPDISSETAGQCPVVTVTIQTN